MFQRRKEWSKLDIPASRIRYLDRSLSDIQVAIPGLPSQVATAYLAVFKAAGGTLAVVALHLHYSGNLVFFTDRDASGAEEMSRARDAGLEFAESMGFMMGDMDLHRLSPPEREKVWNSLPLRKGLAKAEPPPRAAPDRGPASSPQKKPSAGGEKQARTAAVKEEKKVSSATSAPRAPSPSEKQPAAAADKVARTVKIEDEGPVQRRSLPESAAVRTETPSAEEIRERVQALRENLGRFLASF